MQKTSHLINKNSPTQELVEPQLMATRWAPLFTLKVFCDPLNETPYMPDELSFS